LSASSGLWSNPRVRVLLGLWLLAGGCGDPIFTLRGRVLTAQDQALAGARATLWCPPAAASGAARAQAVSDDNGQVRASTVGLVEPACVIEVSASGHQARRLAVADHCARHLGSACRAVDLGDVVLEPQ
jgi:hypothetical protein